MVVTGGYPERERHVPPVIRRAVIARDGGRCRHCGQPGTDIDHIEGGSCEMENLQLLCRTCHNKKTKAGLVETTSRTEGELLEITLGTKVKLVVEITFGIEDYEGAMGRAKRLLSRIKAAVPKRPCDDDRFWDTRYPRFLSERSKALKKNDAQANRNGN